MRKDVYFCDVCERPKGEADHWFLVDYAFDDGHDNPAIGMRPWEGAAEADLKVADLHLCGAECVNKVVAKFLVGQKWK